MLMGLNEVLRSFQASEVFVFQSVPQSFGEVQEEQRAVEGGVREEKQEDEGGEKDGATRASKSRQK